ncbi:MAG: hypothetical protein KAV87_03135 [Desulfobacteraceae bacterium]|nr:hypothetical protein [Desulfobacteraceae bacterium]
MRKLLYGLMAVIMVFGLMGCAALKAGKPGAEEALTAPAKPGPMVVVATPYVKMGSKAKITIVGTGFKPGQEVSLLFTSADGVQADIGYALKPKPKANKIGAWVTTWSCGRYIKKKLIKEGAYSITVADTDYNLIDHCPVAFYKEKKKKKKK